VLHVPIAVKDVGAKNAQAGDQVVVELLQYPGPTAMAKGVIIERLGKRGKPGVDLKSAIHQFHLPHEFSKEVMNEAGQTARRFDVKKALREREDLRDLLVVTIDPDDAKDYDDAISLEKTSSGWSLGVHIADASAFVAEGGALDEEARLRGNSVYLPGMVIPMLPEVLSNGLCSLQEKEDRLTKSVFIEYDKKGKVKQSRFVNGIIRSTKRLTYGDATKILEDKGGRFPPKVKGLVKEMERLARVIQQRRRDQGMLTLDLPEIELVLDDQGRVKGAEPADTSFSHTIIEMFMVEANEASARLLNRFDVAYLRRIHPDPDAATGQKLSQFVRVLGHALPKKVDRKALQGLLGSVKGKPESFAVNLAVLRSMMPAEYSPLMVGHYALASKDYAHFTSPIRRYPDLTVHRLLEAHLTGQLTVNRGASDMPSETEVRALGEHCSFTSRRAEEAERDLKLAKVLELLSKRVGEEFDGVVTGVANSGVFVQIREYMTDGLMRFEEMADDWWEVNERMGSVSGQRTGMRITIGDALKVRILRVNVPGRTLDLTLADAGKGARRSPPGRGKPRVTTARSERGGRRKTQRRRGRR
jgi:ribonuclease R